ncbi:MAG: urea transporter [Gammaproteobacteria bacterium]|nr:urea transporter [Gammaproteobacteria bacterium]
MNRKFIKTEVKQFLKAYAWILFLDHPLAGLTFLSITFWYPNIGICGLLAAITASISVHFFKFTFRESGIHIFNAMLVGLSLGAFYELDATLFLLTIISALLTVFTTVMIMNIAQKVGTLPVLTLPFVIVSITLGFAAKSYGNLSHYLQVKLTDHTWFSGPLDAFFTALGSIFFTPHPMVGAIIFTAILWRSRYLALLSVAGFIVGYNLYIHLSATTHTELAIFNGFNFSLTAMALGAIYTVPGITSFLIACIGSAIAAIITAAAQSFMALYGLPVMAIPFLLTTLTILSALGARQTLGPPWLKLESPGLPEKHFEQARLAKVRIGEVQSVPLLAPFFGTWHIYQGFNGEFTHQPPWQYALDFIVMEDGVSFDENGYVVEDYHCFGLPVVSPVYGQVVRVFDELPDNVPGEVDLKNNWGNFILIQLDSGLFVLLAHLKQHSIKVKENQRISPSEILGACGNTGRSPQPHLHLQVQRYAFLGSETYPFHLTNIITGSSKNKQQLKLIARPEKNDLVTPLEATAELAHPLHLPVGHLLCYRFTDFGGNTIERKLLVTLSLLGEFRLKSDTGASTAFLETNGMLAFFDRKGPKDLFLDMWILAIGLTPFANDVTQWEDSPSASLMPFSRIEKTLYLILYPLGAGLESFYSRNKAEHKKQWSQHGTHTFRSILSKLTAETHCEISFDKGCEYLEMIYRGKKCSAILEDTGILSDTGIPGVLTGD